MNSCAAISGFEYLAGKPGDMRFPRGEDMSCVWRGLLGGALTSRAQLQPCPLGKSPGTGRDEDLVGGAQLIARVTPAALAAQPLAVEQVGAASCMRRPVRPRRSIASR